MRRFLSGGQRRDPEPEEGDEQAVVTAAGPRLYVPRAILADTHQHLAPYRKAQVETACFWFGVEAGEDGVVTTLALPQLLQTAGNYRIVRGSLRRLSKEMRSQGLSNLAQVHTHPKRWVGHSQYDDEHAYSTRDGSLSLVWPDYGLALSHDLAGIGVHERRGGRWARLTDGQVQRRIRVVDSVSDQRWSIEEGDIEDEE